MGREDFSFTWALCASLLLHGLLVYALLAGQQKQLGAALRLAPLPAPAPAEPAPLIRPAPPSAQPEPSAPLPPLQSGELEKMELSNSEFGEASGTGYALNSAAGEQNQRARQGPDDQAYLSHNPVGSGQSAEAMLRVEIASAAKPLPPQAPQPLFGPQTVPGLGPAPRPVRPSLAPPPAAQEPAEPTRAQSAGEDADPAPAADTDSDPFSRIGSVDFSPGRVEARLGRKVRVVRPKLTLAGRYDLLAMNFPRLVLDLKIDAAGKVTDVRTLRTSGSNEVDLPCMVAVYQWWIEPPKDKSGQPIASELELHITWH